jgi:hypothetical protein
VTVVLETRLYGMGRLDAALGGHDAHVPALGPAEGHRGFREVIMSALRKQGLI